VLVTIAIDADAEIPKIKVGPWIIVGEKTYTDKTIILNGDLTIKNGGKLTLNRVVLKINSPQDGDTMYVDLARSITVEKGGELYIYNSTITKGDLKEGYRFKVYGKMAVYDSDVSYMGGSVTVVYRQGQTYYTPVGGIQIYSDEVSIINSTITNGETAGIYCESSSPQIKDNKISNNMWGISCGSSNALIEENIITDNNYGIDGWMAESGPPSKLIIKNNIIRDNGFGVAFRSSVITIINSTIERSKFLDVEIYWANLTTLNVTFDKNKIVVDRDSFLTVQWFLNLYVINEAAMPVSGAKITIIDNLSSMQTHITDTNGQIRNIVCIDYTQTPTKKTNYNPYTIYASNNNLKVDIAVNQDITIILKGGGASEKTAFLLAAPLILSSISIVPFKKFAGYRKKR
jgi:hypothetical protein